MSAIRQMYVAEPPYRMVDSVGEDGRRCPFESMEQRVMRNDDGSDDRSASLTNGPADEISLDRYLNVHRTIISIPSLGSLIAPDWG